MARGQLDPLSIPDDGLTTRQRRMLPVTAVHTGTGKGKSTAAFGMAMRAWNQGMNIGVFQFVKSAKWRVGEESVFKKLGQLHLDEGIGGAVEWHKMGEGWSWSKKRGNEADHARQALEGWEEIKHRLSHQHHDFYVLDEFTYPVSWGWIDIDDVITTLSNRPGVQHIVMTGRNAHPRLIELADLVTDMHKVKHPMDLGRKGQKGIEW
ncbi:cob(I)yrinic acid a,c-diamide adenosyltransferase [Corynebacterium sp. ES2794-CONJ1]|uniref:cob(I)yrinic acid a,c-diamide adenosyltransferase n=1 Tax=unclassified Corynebacterium TaxID=2624378 RepID=UPI002167894A|nr:MULTISPECIES: cob(I)yrinic acid a,c-diamide adenosyltransferase [unclassified Corynebacterium]MCS4489112.1 cob(I)yrinic acid a,c-diamide adenosyltransferase [Corynebacterium sp. ES2775-CONJ]MCS4490925.1 cob(I)yrinic acid a,c-diamide adenosyltransferase [Corynebacterium sp. ES2715-CONJ3]MCS4531193.1 cob(I)yrinic acid a,c-diamide adenosyltransferase [Corynebacterium sp. ES2730-CONJ]MCU9518561.1 cob(I)yrinic acid a,c-diamide adenosyltransferase [Corynebacterium sp. ES2794-CONJ1]